MFRKILIANRGEIACRIARTAKRLGIGTVAVYSDADQQAMHVAAADEAVHLGGPLPRESYLRGDAIIDAAKRTGAEAIHPGYGFLSENAGFARACAEAGIVFIGPSPEAIEAMGSKSRAKQIMGDAGVPLIPGYHGEDQSSEVLQSAAREMGYPVLLKATAGGGGKGMRQVSQDLDFADALAAAKRESAASFGDDRMLVEKYLESPRHVEVQVFADQHDNCIYLAERDCSVQRRHQKVLEEAPAPGLTPEIRAAMGEAAVNAARAIGYCGAGTVEFLYDNGAFYFMEMNTRLQVEHPVTELVTGQDLVEWQLRVAAGEALPLQQSDVRIAGHAIEARVYAEDPDNDFLPATGTLEFLAPPPENRHVRVDTGVQQGDEITVYYDPMIAKLIVWDESRERALDRLASALAAYRVAGTATNLPFLYNVAASEPFRRAELDTGFIDRHREVLWRDDGLDDATGSALAGVALLLDRRQLTRGEDGGDPHSPWGRGNGWRLNQNPTHRVALMMAGESREVSIEEARPGQFSVTVLGQTVPLAARLDGEQLELTLQGHRQRATLASRGDGFTLFLPNEAIAFSEAVPEALAADAAGGNSVTAPMNGTIVSVLKAPGDAVEAGEPLVIMEAMKMEQTLRAPKAGVIADLLCTPGQLVSGGASLLTIEEPEA